ncbi:MAG: hypothetical protein Q8899_01345 [Weeping tea tree witches'-broom phytoplasma]|uniref:hypothetical protein n=1 Tax=Candidatus Phytoplasma melaleucae TaxID=2982630 RepID=UPI00293A5142|nr:hypothetical protein [Weeping tea tree witches'-broom phytoplasma]
MFIPVNISRLLINKKLNNKNLLTKNKQISYKNKSLIPKKLSKKIIKFINKKEHKAEEIEESITSMFSDMQQQPQEVFNEEETPLSIESTEKEKKLNVNVNNNNNPKSGTVTILKEILSLYDKHNSIMMNIILSSPNKRQEIINKYASYFQNTSQQFILPMSTLPEIIDVYIDPFEDVSSSIKQYLQEKNLVDRKYQVVNYPMSVVYNENMLGMTQKIKNYYTNGLLGVFINKSFPTQKDQKYADNLSLDQLSFETGRKFECLIK